MNLRIKNKKISSFSFFICVFLLFFLISSFTSCRLYMLKQKLPPGDKEFLSKVRYIITSKERKIFLELPDEEREEFKKEFWKRRDPDPTTEVNEFKREYFNRMERANQLFLSEGRPGWQTDRGRIYILFGPPTNRITNPVGGNTYSRCREVWYYGNFPVVFVDRMCTGDYELVTYDLSSLRSLNLRYMHELNLAQAASQQTIRRGEKQLFDFNWKIKKIKVTQEKIEGRVFIEVPYANLWFKEKNSSLVTVLDLHLKLRNSQEEIIWEYTDLYKVKVDEENLKQKKDQDYKIEVPFILEEDLDKLREGENKFFVTLKNRTGGKAQKKVIPFKVKERLKSERKG
ncbi:GWxTD domain-containing protein [bacterium]|nr:GWxTD domain-containing protein [bacterium]